MGKIIVDLAVTLDGYISGPDGEIDWLVKEEEKDFGDILADILDGIDAIFYGRVSYDLWGNYQPDEKASSKLKESYKLLHSKTKYVFSRTKKGDDSKAIFINSKIKENILEIKQKVNGNIWLYGGGKLINTLMNLGFVDEYRLAVHPVIIGNGLPVFKDIKERIGLELLDFEKSKSGIVVLTYAAKSKNNPSV
ncbi:dihydrofolate reductase family protein [Algoriphagus resistens]|uniref:dihydrofolate reductase family protein n=1 Tax=Algoriphagus resistens TaxID=1750590 RepID=UPI000716BA28|nr:dihydrofolate reductase family protein [Algoriphagus resistens]